MRLDFRMDGDKKFVRWFLCLVFGGYLALIPYIYFFPMNFMDIEYPYWMQQKAYCLTKSERQEVIFLGDSAMKTDIIPRELSEDAYLLALGGASPIEMYYTLAHYLENHPAPRVVFMGFMIRHYVSYDSYWNRTMYFNYLSPQEVFETESALALNDGEQKDTLRHWGYLCRLPHFYGTALWKSLLFLRRPFNIKTYETAVETRGRMFAGKTVNKVGFLDQEESFALLPSNVFYLKKMMDLCEAKRIPVILEQLPISKSTFDCLSETYIDSYVSCMETLGERWRVESQIVWYDDAFFSDAEHLNERGAAKYTRYIREKYPEIF